MLSNMNGSSVTAPPGDTAQSTTLASWMLPGGVPQFPRRPGASR